ncbi:hypothetical protein N7467_003999 [Penicillium canescens]|nr:hypothetical protein N7467_003999 [Penicillium canescens]
MLFFSKITRRYTLHISYRTLLMRLIAPLKAEILKRHPKLMHLPNDEATLELLLDVTQEA